MTDCIFCKITAGEMDTKFIYEDEQLVVFADLHPKAPTHVLLVPKRHINSLTDITDDDAPLMAHLVATLPKVAKILDLKGFRTIINTGREGGQVIDHLHFHLLAGNLSTFV